MSDEELLEKGAELKKLLAGCVRARDRTFEVFTGNGFQYHYISDEDYNRSPDTYKNGLMYILNEVEDYLISNNFFIKLDKSCCNLARLARLPYTYNTGRVSKYGLAPRQSFVVEARKDARTSLIYILDELEKEYLSKYHIDTTPAPKKEVYLSGDEDIFEAINKIPIEQLVYGYCGVKIAKNGKDFVSPKNGDNVGMYVRDNCLGYCGTHYINAPKGGAKGYNCFSFIQEHYSLSTADTVRWFIKNYREIEDIDNHNKKVFKEKTKDLTPLKKQIQSQQHEIGTDELWVDPKEIVTDYSYNPFTRGIKEIDKKFTKINRRGELVLFYGLPGQGKTEFAFFVARKNRDVGIKSLFLSLELPKATLIERRSISACGFTQTDVDSGKLSTADIQKIEDTKKKVLADTSDGMMIIGVSRMPTLQEVLQILDNKLKEGFGLFFIDNLGKIDRGKLTEMEAFDVISNAIQTRTLKNNTRVILLHHASKGFKGKSRNPEDVMSDSAPAGANGFRGNNKLYDNSQRLLEIHRGSGSEVTLFQYKHTYGGWLGFVYMLFDNGTYTSLSTYGT